MLTSIKNLFQYRHLILALLARGFKAKYKNSYLGVFWSLLNPLLNVAIFAFVFTVIIKIGIKNYPLYLLCTIFPWTFFLSAITNSVLSIVEDAPFVKNVPFPSEILPLAVVLINFINLLIDLLIMMPLLFILSKSFSINWLYLSFLLACELLLACGLSILAAGLFVIFRDINFILNLGLRLFFYFLPVIYNIDFVPASLKTVYRLNPMAVIIEGFASVLFYRQTPNLGWLAIAFLESLLVFIICFGLFQRFKRIIPERM
jgi:ABC-2 type transport system permease protein